jgi:hypothetical protein
MEDLILMPKYPKNKKPKRLRKPSRPIDGVNHRLLREQVQPVEVPEIHEVPDDNAPPTRDELVQKAKELGIRVTKRTSDEKLLEKITEALGG